MTKGLDIMSRDIIRVKEHKPTNFLVTFYNPCFNSGPIIPPAEIALFRFLSFLWETFSNNPQDLDISNY